MHPYLFRFYTVLAIVAVPLAIVLNLAHPFLHGLEGGSLDAMLPWINATAGTTGAGKLLEWASNRSHRGHDHGDGCPFDDVRAD